MVVNSGSRGFSLTNPNDERGQAIKAGAYVRLSHDPEGDRLAVTRQLQEIKALLERRGWELAEVFEDDDRSAFSGKPRERYLAMLEELEAGSLDAVVAWHPDRLHRSPKELEKFIDVIEARHAAVVTVQGGEYDLSTASGRMTARVVGAVARHESEHRSERLKAWARQRAENGYSGASRRPFGYIDPRRSAIVPEEAEVIKDVAQRVLAGDSLRLICRELNAKGVRTVSGKPWQTTTLRGMLMNAGISGRRQTHMDAPGRTRRLGRIVGDGSWDAILTVEDSERLRAKLTDPTRRTNGRVAERLLTGKKGVGRCWCGAALVSQNRHDRGNAPVPTLSCTVGSGKDRVSGKGHVRITMEPVDSLVAEAVIRAVDDGALEKLLKQPEDKQALVELGKVEEMILQSRQDWRSGLITRAEWESDRADLEGKKKALESRLERSRRAVGLAGLPEGPLRASWPKLPLARQRAIIGAIVEQVVISPPTRRGGTPGVKGSSSDPSRVSIVWKA